MYCVQETDNATTQTQNGCSLKKKRLRLRMVFISGYKHDLSVERIRLVAAIAKFIGLHTN